MVRIPNCISVSYLPDASECVSYAAEELNHWLGSAGFQVSEAGPDDRKAFSVVLHDHVPGLPGGAFRRTVTAHQVLLESSEGCGIVYGMYDFLEDLGFRFLTPDCTTIPSSPLELEEGVHEEKPAFQAREVFWRAAIDGSFAVRLRLNSARSTITPRQGGKLMFYNFSHSFNALVPVEKWYDTHPEYFSMKNNRRLREKTQLCLSNPDVLRLCIQGVRTWIHEHPDCTIFSVSMNDWYNACECPACRAVDEEEGSQAGSVIRFVNAIADNIAEDYPQVMIHTFAYLYCRRPPKHVRPRKNVIVRLCSIECCFSHPIGICRCERGGINVQYGSAANFSGAPSSGAAFPEDLKGWSAICDNLFVWDYTTNYANYLLPFPNLDVLKSNLLLFHQYGVKGVLEQGNFSHGQCSALGQLKTYLVSKLLWDPHLDTDALIQDFVEGYYGPAASPMLSYVRLWQHAAGKHHAGIYDMPDADYLTDDLLSQAQALLRQAQALAEKTLYGERVEREALSVRYAFLTREPPETAEHHQAVTDFMNDVRRLGITELFERKDLEASGELLRRSRYARNRQYVPAITYPI